MKARTAKMKNNRIMRVFIALAAALTLTAVFSITAFAYTDEPQKETPTPASAPEAAPEPTPEPTPAPLTPEGNLTLVDDLTVTDEQSKQFITVITKSGNYFYIVIDRAGDRENVHFLNLVDEADLLAIIEENGGTAVTPPAPETPAQETTEEPAEPAPEPEKNNTGGLVIMLVLIAALGGGAFCYFKVLKPKQGTKGSTAVSELDDFDFEDEPDGYGATDGYGEPDAIGAGASDDYGEPEADGGDADADPAADEDFDIGEPPEMEEHE
jgi:flagellar basal body-associated protein FliL